MKRYFKRGLALLLAVALVVSAGLYGSSDRTLRATEEDEIYTEEALQEEGENPEEGSGLEPVQTVQEVVIEELPVEELPSEEPPTDENSAQGVLTEETPVEGSSEEAPAEETTIEENTEEKAPAEEGLAEEADSSLGQADSEEAEPSLGQAVSEEEIETEEKMPAVKLTGRAGNTLVELSAPEGVLPEGATMQAKLVSLPQVEAQLSSELNEEGRELLTFVAVDITLYNRAGEEIQPKGEVSVVFRDALADEKIDVASVYHVDTASGAVDKVADLDASASDASFQAEHFSVYVLGAAGKASVPEEEEPAGEPVLTDREGKPLGESLEIDSALPFYVLCVEGKEDLGWNVDDDKVISLVQPVFDQKEGKGTVFVKPLQPGVATVTWGTAAVKVMVTGTSIEILNKPALFEGKVPIERGQFLTLTGHYWGDASGKPSDWKFTGAGRVEIVSREEEESSSTIVIQGVTGNKTPLTLSWGNASVELITRGQGQKGTFTPTIENAELAYVAYHTEADLAYRDLTPLAAGQPLVVENYTTNGLPGYIVFFVKPASGYLLTGLGASGNNDLYLVKGENNKGNINGYPGLSELCRRAEAQGYVACFGYYAGNNQGKSAEFTVKGYQPGLEADIVSDKYVGIKKGDTLTLTVTVTPETQVNGKKLTVSNVTADSITVNGVEVASPSLTSDGKGGYVGTIKYTVTDSDCAQGKLTLAVNASVDYAYSLGLSTETAITEVETKGDDVASCLIAPQGTVVYAYKYFGLEKEKAPAEITKEQVKVVTEYAGEEFELMKSPYAGKPRVEDPVNGGYWVYSGWYRDGELLEAAKMVMPEAGMIVYGHWTFQPYKQVVIKVDDKKKTYGQEDPDFTYRLKGADKSELKELEQVKVAREGGQEDAGVYPNVLTVNQKTMAALREANPNYAFTVEKGKFTIDKRPVTISVKDASKFYGEADPAFDEATMEGQVAGELADLDLRVKRSNSGVEDLGTYRDVLTLSQTKAELDRAHTNYIFTIKPGAFEIKLNTTGLTAVAKSYNELYDGQSHRIAVTPSIPGAKIMYSETKTGPYTDENPGYTDVTGGSKTVYYKVSLYGYAEVSGEATVTITPVTLRVTTESDSKLYDGGPLTAGGKVEGLVDGEEVTFRTTGSQTLVGESENTYEINWNKNAKESNYVVEEKLGVLTVTRPSDGVVLKSHDNHTVYKPGDEVIFTIQVENIYDEAKTITLEEQENVSLGISEFQNVQPGEIAETKASYTVTEEDILNGFYKNTVRARFSGVEEPYEGSDTVDQLTDPRPHMTVYKETVSEPANGSFYVKGETVTYAIWATNDGNVTLTNVVLTDELTGNTGSNKLEVGVLAPGQSSERFTVSYTVTASDLVDRQGVLINVATGEGESPRPDLPKPEVTPGETKDPVETAQPSLYLEKTSDLEDGKKAALGELVTYTIRVTNNGNVTISDVKIVDPLTKAEWLLDKIEPLETVEYKTEYQVTEDDLRDGSVENVASAKGKDPTGEPIQAEDSEVIPTERPVSHVTITKEVTNQPADGKAYGLGEVIVYRITAVNDGSLTVNNLVITDELTGDTWSVESLKPGESVSKEARYTVTREDIFQKEEIVNLAKGEAEPSKQGDPQPEVKPGEVTSPVQEPYTLRIHYVDTAGNTLALDFVGQYAVGEKFQVNSPQIPGYTPNYSAIRSGEGGMPAQDLEFQVVYTANRTDAEVPEDTKPQNPPSPTPPGETPTETPSPTPPGETPTETPSPTPPGETPTGTPAGTPTETPTGTPAGTSIESPAETPEDSMVGMIAQDEDGGYYLIPVEDIRTPLGKLDLGDHDCCFFHFLVMLIAAILLGFYTRSRKKHQKKIFELREALELEKQRRGITQFSDETKR